LISQQEWPVRALALETGRLDDVFGTLTRKPRPLADTANVADGGGA